MPFHLDGVTVKRDDQSSGVFRGNFKTKKYFQRQKTLICFCSLLLTFCQLVVRQFFISRKSFKKLIFKILERFCKCQENIRLRLVTRSPTGNLQSLTSFPRFFSPRVQINYQGFLIRSHYSNFSQASIEFKLAITKLLIK